MDPFADYADSRPPRRRPDRRQPGCRARSAMRRETHRERGRARNRPAGDFAVAQTGRLPARKPPTRASVARIVLVLLLALGLGLLAWPAASDAYASWKAEGVISAASSRYQAEGDPACQEVKRQARLYNLVLAGGSAQEDPLPYEQQLVFHGDPMISYLQVPLLGLKLPIYHGTSESALMAGVGHLETSSLPVGGAGCHCVLAGHSGMSEARMFDGLERLSVGDRFIVWTLGEPYAYEVYAIDTVLPDETDSLALQPGRDLCTLVTCTPYGVNSHRLLVHGERCEYSGGDAQPASAPQADGRLAPAVAAAAIAACALLAIAAGAVARHRRAGVAHMSIRK